MVQVNELGALTPSTQYRYDQHRVNVHTWGSVKKRVWTESIHVQVMSACNIVMVLAYLAV